MNVKNESNVREHKFIESVGGFLMIEESFFINKKNISHLNLEKDNTYQALIWYDFNEEEFKHIFGSKRATHELLFKQLKEALQA